MIGNIDDIENFVFNAFGVVVNVTDDIPGEVALEQTSGALTQGERRSVEQLAPLSAGVSITITNWP